MKIILIKVSQDWKEDNMTTKAKHKWRSHKTNEKVIFKGKDKAHKEKHLDNVLNRSEKEVKED